jgi:hypothetical protein
MLALLRFHSGHGAAIVFPANATRAPSSPLTTALMLSKPRPTAAGHADRGDQLFQCPVHPNQQRHDPPLFLERGVKVRSRLCPSTRISSVSSAHQLNISAVGIDLGQYSCGSRWCSTIMARCRAWQMTAFKTASKNRHAAPGGREQWRRHISIVPFNKDVNVGSANSGRGCAGPVGRQRHLQHSNTLPK